MYKLADYITVEQDGELENYVLMDLNEGRLFRLNNAAKNIIDAIVECGDIKTYVESICEKCDVEYDVVEQDTKRYVYQLLDSGYIYEY